MLYSMSEFVNLIKENIGTDDIPMPVDDAEIVRRLCQSTLKEFSVRCPRIKTIYIGDECRLNDDINNISISKRMVYRIPKHHYIDSQILAVSRVDVSRPNGYSDLYVPQGMWASPVSILSAIADIKIAAASASTMGRAPTFKFVAPDILEIFNGWSSGTYEVDIELMHDPSLSTIPPTAFTHLLQLAELDISEFLYNKLKRKENLDTGVGNIQLKLDSWESAGREKRELLEKWDNEGANLDIDNITYF